jgi:hypothetical protein
MHDLHYLLDLLYLIANYLFFVGKSCFSLHKNIPFDFILLFLFNIGFKQLHYLCL